MSQRKIQIYLKKETKKTKKKTTCVILMGNLAPKRRYLNKTCTSLA